LYGARSASCAAARRRIAGAAIIKVDAATPVPRNLRRVGMDVFISSSSLDPAFADWLAHLPKCYNMSNQALR
jgi:hypothetical protein